MFGRGKAHEGEIPLAALPDLPPDAWEIARFWVSEERSFVAVGRPEGWSPELLGSLIVESMCTAASGYAASGMSETEALRRMWDGLDQERLRLSGPDGQPPEEV